MNKKLTPVEFRGNELWGKEYCSIEELDISSIDRLLAIVKPVGNGDFSDEIKSFIVAAVNNHDRLTRERDELIKALENIVDRYKTVEQAREVLRRVKGGNENG